MGNRGFYRQQVSAQATGGVFIPNYRNKEATPTLSIAVDLADTPNLTYSVEYTLDDIQSGDTPVWHAHTDLTAKTANATGAIYSPVSGIRLNVTAHVTGNAAMKILQPY